MTKREQMAAMMLSAIATGASVRNIMLGPRWMQKASEEAIELADTLLTELNRTDFNDPEQP